MKLYCDKCEKIFAADKPTRRRCGEVPGVAERVFRILTGLTAPGVVHR